MWQWEVDEIIWIMIALKISAQGSFESIILCLRVLKDIKTSTSRVRLKLEWYPHLLPTGLSGFSHLRG